MSSNLDWIINYLGEVCNAYKKHAIVTLQICTFLQFCMHIYEIRQQNISVKIHLNSETISKTAIYSFPYC